LEEMGGRRSESRTAAAVSDLTGADAPTRVPSAFCAVTLGAPHGMAANARNTAAHATRRGGNVWESNPPNPTSSGRSGFEDRESHQAPSAPKRLTRR